MLRYSCVLPCEWHFGKFQVVNIAGPATLLTVLYLQAYEHHGGTSSVVHIVSQLPAQHLQHLHLCFDDHAMDLKAVVPALTAFTGLNSLTLRRYVHWRTLHTCACHLISDKQICQLPCCRGGALIAVQVCLVKV